MTAATFKFTADFLIETFRRFRLQHGGRWVMAAVKVLAVLLSAPLGIWALREGQVLLGIFFLVLCVLMFFAPHMDYWLVRRSFRQSPFRGEDVRIEFSDSGFHATSPKQDIKLQWSAFTRVVHFKDGFLLFHGPRSFNWVPVSSLAGLSDIAELEALLRSKIADHRIVEPVAPPNGSSATRLGNPGVTE
jgi:hypothetical protein